VELDHDHGVTSAKGGPIARARVVPHSGVARSERGSARLVRAADLVAAGAEKPRKRTPLARARAPRATPEDRPRRIDPRLLFLTITRSEEEGAVLQQGLGCCARVANRMLPACSRLEILGEREERGDRQEPPVRRCYAVGLCVDFLVAKKEGFGRKGERGRGQVETRGGGGGGGRAIAAAPFLCHRSKVAPRKGNGSHATRTDGGRERDMRATRACGAAR